MASDWLWLTCQAFSFALPELLGAPTEPLLPPPLVMTTATATATRMTMAAPRIAQQRRAAPPSDKGGAPADDTAARPNWPPAP
jgi:hypothetical protein